MACATPDSLLDLVTRFAAAWISSTAFSMAMPSGACEIMERSLISSPMAAMRDGSMPRWRASHETALHFVASRLKISRM